MGELDYIIGGEAVLYGVRYVDGAPQIIALSGGSEIIQAAVDGGYTFCELPESDENGDWIDGDIKHLPQGRQIDPVTERWLAAFAEVDGGIVSPLDGFNTRGWGGGWDDAPWGVNALIADRLLVYGDDGGLDDVVGGDEGANEPFA